MDNFTRTLSGTASNNISNAQLSLVRRIEANMIIGSALFMQGDLDSYLRQQDAALRPFIEKFLSSHPETELGVIVQAILKEARVEPLVVHFDKVNKDATPAKVSIIDWGREIVIDGVRATRSFPFSGEPDLFKLRPNTFTSVIPYGLLARGTVVIGLEGRNDPPSLKAELDRQEQLLKDYVDWQRPTVDLHNSSLQQKIERLVSDRRKHLADIQNLKNLI